MPDADTTIVERQPAHTVRTSTVELLTRGRAGDRDAIGRLFERCLPPLRRWARGRLPTYARGSLETNDIVQETVYNTLRRLDQFEPRHEGALQAYLRLAVANRIRDEIRRARRKPPPDDLDDDQVDEGPSPLEHAIGREALARYEAALACLRPEDRELIVARVELHYSYADMMKALGKPSPDAARVAVSRALVRLARAMERQPR